MLALLRLTVFGFAVLTVIYVLVSIYSASVRREKLEREWDTGPSAGGDAAARRQFIDEGMAAYRHGLRRKLILGVYVVPVVAVVAMIYFLNFN